MLSLLACDSGGKEGEGKNPTQAQEKITLQNWMHHPEIRKIRKIVEETKAGVKDGRITVKRRVFDRHSKQCTDPYPEISNELGLDKQGNVRFLIMTKMLTMEVRGTREYYYDEAGQLRFILLVFGEYEGPDKDRVYFNEKGDVLIAVKETDGNFLARKYSKSTAIADRAFTPQEAEQIFLADTSCPEIKAQIGDRPRL